ncbi:hypothetical protein GGR55DRAFT_232992 [Xylaria sp. FL0064]|nr:hypothetical protein GGR55DRAFT_232992 [Xylaria sp. FL0064]
MLEPNAIIGIIGSSVGLIVTLIGLASKSVGVPRSRQHLLEVRRQKKVLKHKLRRVQDEINLLNGINAKGVRHLRRETRNLIGHSRVQIEKFDRFYKRFIESRTVRTLNYITISAGSDKICKYVKRFEVYSDWITIAQLSIYLTLISERASLGGSSVSSLDWRDIDRLRYQLDRVKRAQEAHPGRLRKLHVNKGVNLGRLERYAEGLVLRFNASDTDITESSIVIIDDPLELPAQYLSISSSRDWYRGHGQVRQACPPIDRFNRTGLMYYDQAYDNPRAPPNIYTSANRPRQDHGRTQAISGPKHSRSRSRTATVNHESSDSRRSVTPTRELRHYSDNEWNTAPFIPQRGPHPRERHRHRISSGREYSMTSGFGRSESEESSRQSRRHTRSGSRSHETPTRPRSHQSYRSERGSDQEVRGREIHRRSSQDNQRYPTPLQYRPQSKSSNSSRRTNVRQEQQRYQDVANIDIRPSTRRHRSRSSSANVSSVPSRDSGYGSLGSNRYSTDASVTSTRRRSGSRQRRREEFRSGGDDRSRPPIALDRAEKKIRRAEERARTASHRAR